MLIEKLKDNSLTEKHWNVLKKYDENGKLIVYSEEVYFKMWIKNKNLKVTPNTKIDETKKLHGF